MSLPSIIRLITSIVICQLAGVIGSLFTSPAIPGWYASLTKPAFNPPSWLFGPVWITLYLLMGIALFLVWQKGISKTHLGMIFFIAQLLLNALWSYLFFGLQNPFIALIEIAFLLAFIILTIVYFWSVSRPASILLIPYALWVAFASVLNFSIWWLNK